MADCITLKSMCFHARVGIYPHELQLAQPIEIDLTVELSRVAPHASVDYTKLYAAAALVMQADHIDYLEDIAERVANGALQIAGVEIAHVAVRKPHVPLPGPLAYAEVSITRPTRG